MDRTFVNKLTQLKQKLIGLVNYGLQRGSPTLLSIKV